jgi:mycothiol conjugate amidase Mca
MAEELTLLAVHAHPDDEVIGTGGILARYAEEGRRVVLVCATRGEVGEIVDPSFDEETSRPRLAAIREEELRCACAVLGVPDLRFLDYRDSGMMGTADNENPACFWQANLDEATGRLVHIIRAVRPHVMVTYDEKGGYGHPDHIMTHRVAVAAFDAAADSSRFVEGGLLPWQPAKLYYTAMKRSWLQFIHRHLIESGLPSPFDRPDLDPERLGTPDELITASVKVLDQLNKKRQALMCHRTQIAADSFFFNAPDDVTKQGLGYEYFVRARSMVPAPTEEDDLFAGL